jgi:hypothetical protein
LKKIILLLAVLSVVTGLSAADGEVRIFVSSSDSWSVGGGGFVGSNFGGGGVKGGARPQTVEIMKTFRERCPEVIVTINQDKADFIIFLEHEGGKGLVRKDNKVAVFNKEGDMIHANSTRSLGNSVKDSCRVIKDHSGKSAD